MTVRILTGHVLDRLAELPPESVHCCVCSPPYYGLRDYGIEPQVWGGDPGCEHVWRDTIVAPRHNDDGISGSTLLGGKFTQAQTQRQSTTTSFCTHCTAWRGSLGLEPTPTLYVEHMVAVFRAVRRVLRKDGTLWLNIGDSYAASASGKHPNPWVPKRGGSSGRYDTSENYRRDITRTFDCKPKDLLGMPWMLAFALRDDGWYLRSEITWAKRAPMPESVTDRPTSATEKIFLLSRSARYFYDGEAVKEDSDSENSHVSPNRDPHSKDYHNGRTERMNGYRPEKRNMRNWWLLGPEPFAEAHFATFPTEIPRRAILAGCPTGGTVLDPFAGAGTTLLVADQLQRDAIGIELNPEYAAMAERRIYDDAPLFAHVEVRLPAANLLMRGDGLGQVRQANGLDLETMPPSKPNTTIDLEG